MITLGFLIVIAPLVTVTYSIDKMGDGKSQALNAWMREFVYNILIQPFHCIAYLALGSAGVSILDGSGELSMASVVIAIMIFIFMLTSEKIIKEIFHFRASSMSDTVGSAVFAGAVLSKMKDAGGKSKSGGGGGSNKYADPKSMIKPKANAKNVKPGGDQSRLELASQSGNMSSGNISNAQASSRNTQKPLKKRSAFGKALEWYASKSLKLGMGLAGGAFFAGATGDLKNALPAAGGMAALGGKLPTALSKRNRRMRLAKAYNDYADHLAKENPNLTTDEINERTRMRAVNLMQNNLS